MTQYTYKLYDNFLLVYHRCYSEQYYKFTKIVWSDKKYLPIRESNPGRPGESRKS